MRSFMQESLDLALVQGILERTSLFILSDLIQNLAKLGLGLKLSRSAKRLLSKNGYDPKYGVRLLRREIQKSLEDPISELLLKRVFSDGTILSVTVRQKKFHFDIKKTSKVSRRKPKSPAK